MTGKTGKHDFLCPEPTENQNFLRLIGMIELVKIHQTQKEFHKNTAKPRFYEQKLTFFN